MCPPWNWPIPSDGIILLFLFLMFLYPYSLDLCLETITCMSFTTQHWLWLPHLGDPLLSSWLDMALTPYTQLPGKHVLFHQGYSRLKLSLLNYK